MLKSQRLAALWMCMVFMLAFSGSAQAGLFRLSGTFSSSGYSGPLNGGTFEGTYEFDGVSTVADFDILLRDSSANVLAELNKSTGSASVLRNWGSSAYDAIQFFDGNDFLALTFASGFVGEGAVVPFPVNIPYASFAGIGANTVATDSGVDSGLSARVPEPATLALVASALIALRCARRVRPV